MVEPLPLVPATWITGGSRRSGWPSRSSMRHMRSSERSMLFRMQRRAAARLSNRAVIGCVRRRARRSRGRRPAHRRCRQPVVGCIGRRRRRSVPAARRSSAGALVSSRHSRASVGRSSWRCTTMSTMPCSRRYSARWKPSGSFSRMVCSMTRGPAKPISAPGSAIWTSPSIA